MSPAFILGAVFAATMALVAAGGRLWMKRRPDKEAEPQFSVPAPEEGGVAHDLLLRLGNALPPARKAGNPYQNKLAAAGYRRESALPVYYGVKTGLAAVLSVFCALASASSGGGPTAMLAAALCGAGFGFLVPDRILKMRIESRTRDLREGLSSALDLMILAIEAGQGIDAALMETSRGLATTNPALSRELRQAHLEMRTGKAREEALQSFARRNGEPELRKFASLLVDADRYGTNLGPALRSHAKYLRTRIRQHAQEAARKIGVKLIFPVFFLIFPAVLLVTLGPACIMVYNQFQLMLKGIP
jgi:tight adherence protein C